MLLDGGGWGRGEKGPSWPWEGGLGSTGRVKPGRPCRLSEGDRPQEHCAEPLESFRSDIARPHAVR